MAGLDEMSLCAAVARLRSGAVSSAELVEAALAAAERAAGLGAFVALDGERALRDARRPHPGPLHGVPVAVKDLVDVAGLPTRAGTAASDPAPARTDAAIVTRLRDAGAVVIGKTATHELGYGVITHGVVNPAAPERIAGGSSGGSAVAVAAGIVPLALGTDTAGSVRVPAACCQVCGMTAAPGTLPAAGVTPLSPSFDTLGPIVPEPGDLALAWAALAGSGDPSGAGIPSGAARGAWHKSDVTRRKDAKLPAAVRIVDPALLGRVDPAALEAVDALAERLALPVQRVAPDGPDGPPPWRDWTDPRTVVIGAEALAAHRAAGLYPDRANLLGPDIRAAHADAERRPAADVAAARARLAALAHRLRAAVPPGTILLTPALPSPPPLAATVDPATAGRLTRLLAPVNAAGLAAAVVPGGPCGVQLVARDPATLLSALARL